MAARARAVDRQGCANTQLDGSRVEAACELDAKARGLLEQAMRRLALTARGYHRLLRVTRTIADLACSGRATEFHLSEAITLRQLDRRFADISR
jgi:magnesium chelatase family protein